MLTDFPVCTGCAILTIWLSFAQKRARRPRPNTSTCTQYVYRAGCRKRAPLRSRTWLLHRQRTPCHTEGRGDTKTGLTVPGLAEQVRHQKFRRGVGAWECRPRTAARPAWSSHPSGSSNGSVPSYKFWFYTSGPDLYRIARATNRAGEGKIGLDTAG